MRDLGREILVQSLRQVLPENGGPDSVLTVTGLRSNLSDDLVLDIPRLTLSGTGISMVLGPNGAGKSMLIRMLHGLTKPDTGRVIFTGGSQAMVFQNPVLLRRSVIANLKFALKDQRLSRGDRAEKLAYLLELAGLKGKERQSARSLSGGEEQCLALACALARRPRLLFLDEPTSSLDPTATHRIETILRQVALMGIKIVMVSHDLGQVERLADEVIFLNRGRICERLPVESFFSGPDSAEARAYLSGQLVL